MSKKRETTHIQTDVAPLTNQNFRCRIVFRAAGPQELLVVATSTNVFTTMQSSFLSYLGGSGSKYSSVPAPGWTITVYWPDVVALHTWQD